VVAFGLCDGVALILIMSGCFASVMSFLRCLWLAILCMLNVFEPMYCCHHSPRQISLTFRQDPIYLDGDPFISVLLLSTNHANHHFRPRHSSHPPFSSG